ncbi:uncharacterized protein LOC126750102 [Anthonomus grandis grandis]|uniref:uncharacterized protein LOC126750102 n=1 Tax=Anthonomus grandis grandis TaxID=2921223 RepID=UPI002165081B|nr:uncharacterized protein LOC126750102 [Anthonomus grandis grandis]
MLSLRWLLVLSVSLSCAVANVVTENAYTGDNVRFDTSNVLSTIATHLMARQNGDGESQIISLNLSNLLVLILLKGLIFAAASLVGYKGHYGGHYGRSLDPENKSLLSDEEIVNFLRYLAGNEH